MKIKGIVWLGTRTDQFEQMTDFCRSMLGLSQRSIEPGFAVFEMPNGDLFEVFGPQEPSNTFMSHPVAGFLVDDILAARAEMEAKGIEFIKPPTNEFYGIEALFKDGCGNWFSLTEHPKE